MKTLPNDIAEALSTVRVPGDFYAAGTIGMYLPLLQVHGVGAVALPLLPVQAQQLVGVAERAPYGRGGETIVDTAVRRTWQIGADRIRVGGKGWETTLQAIVDRVATGLGVTAGVTTELYKLLVYDEGSFFVSHRDTEKAPGMFATLVIALPSAYAGGELLVRHKGREVRLDLGSSDPSEVAFAAFYADCVHEVLPLTSGCRLVLVYNLLRKGKGPLPVPPSYEAEGSRLQSLLERWSAGKGTLEVPAPEKIVYPLEHAYTQAELAPHALKGIDAAAAAVLSAAAKRSGCDFHLALMTIEESGSATYSDRRGREFEADEVCERSATLSDWRSMDGSIVEMGELPFFDHELSPSGGSDRERGRFVRANVSPRSLGAVAAAAAACRPQSGRSAGHAALHEGACRALGSGR